MDDKVQLGSQTGCMKQALCTVTLTVTVPAWVPAGRMVWATCQQLSPHLGEEPIFSPTEVCAVLNAQGRLVARLLNAPGVPQYKGFRIVARHSRTGALVGMAEWSRSAETSQLLPAVETWVLPRKELVDVIYAL